MIPATATEAPTERATNRTITCLSLSVWYPRWPASSSPRTKAFSERANRIRKNVEINIGDEVITSGGIIGKVDRVFEDDRIELEIAEGVKVQVIRNTVQGHLKKEEVKK